MSLVRSSRIPKANVRATEIITGVKTDTSNKIVRSHKHSIIYKLTTPGCNEYLNEDTCTSQHKEPVSLCFRYGQLPEHLWLLSWWLGVLWEFVLLIWRYSWCTFHRGWGLVHVGSCNLNHLPYHFLSKSLDQSYVISITRIHNTSQGKGYSLWSTYSYQVVRA